MTILRCVFLLLMVCCLPATLAGCFGTSPKSRFYTLTPAETRVASEAKGHDTAVAIGPVTIPDYLNRKQIVTRSGRNEIIVAEFDRWGGSLDGEITNVLVANVASRINSMGIAVFPWRDAHPANVRKEYRIPVRVARFDGTPGEKVVLNATWGVYVKGEKQENCQFSTESTITEEVNGRGYDALVAAMGNAVEKLGKEVADRIMKMAADKSPQR